MTDLTQYKCIPLGPRILIRRDESKKVTQGGIALPDSVKIPQITGIVMEISSFIQDECEFDIEVFDRVLFHPGNGIPVDLEQASRNRNDDNMLIVPIDDVFAIFRKIEDTD